MEKSIILRGFDSEPLVYSLTRKRVKNINLRIYPDGRVCVSAPKAVPLHVIEAFLHDRADYIMRARTRFAERSRLAPAPITWADGDACRYLGRTLILRFSPPAEDGAGNDAANTARVVDNGPDKDGELYLFVRDPADPALRRRAYERWCRSACEALLSSICREIYPYFAAWGIAFPELRFRRMVSRWGSCQPTRGIVTFNLFLIEAPRPCAEYVAAHEFVHFLHPDHSARFYEELARVMPDWRVRKTALERAGIVLRRPD